MQEAFAQIYVPTRRERFWRWVGFRHHHGDETEGGSKHLKSDFQGRNSHSQLNHLCQQKSLRWVTIFKNVMPGLCFVVKMLNFRSFALDCSLLLNGQIFKSHGLVLHFRQRRSAISFHLTAPTPVPREM